MTVQKVGGGTVETGPTTRQNMTPRSSPATKAHCVNVAPQVSKRNSLALSVFFDALAAALFCGLLVAIIIAVCGALMVASPR